MSRENIVSLVCGAPGSGKTTFVNERRHPGDLVWDFDAVMHAITGGEIHATPGLAVPYAMAMREAFYREARQPNGHRVWIIESCPTAAERLRFVKVFNAGVILLETPEDICIDRVRERGPRWPSLVSDWYAKFNADRVGTVKQEQPLCLD